MSKVVVLRCDEYDLIKVKEKINYGLDLLGGIESIIPLNKLTLLKPNLVSAAAPEKAATTHPIIFEAISQILIDHKYKFHYGDSPGFGNPTKVSEKCGLKSVAERLNIEEADFVNSKKLSLTNASINKEFDIALGVIKSDAIINLPKMKSHALQRTTGAIKNTFGVVTGFNKGAMHAKYTNAFNFAEMIIDLNKMITPDLHIMDGIMAMEGNGPRNGNPVKMNVILISTDPVAMDAVFAKLINLDPELLPLITYGERMGIGNYHDIELLGDKIDDLINTDFDIIKTPLRTEDMTQVKLLAKYVIRRPFIKKRDCKKCGICVKACPLDDKALSFKNNDKTTVPVYDYLKCIRCYCCQEMCPYEVIDVKTPIIGKVIYGLKLLK